MDIDQFRLRRMASWCQDGEHRVSDPVAAKPFIERHGIVTHYGASTEVPSLFAAYMSDPTPKTDSSWDSPSGHVYEWRWALGRSEAAFYSGLVAKKPTWVAWDMLSLVMGFARERRDPEDLYRDGLLSNEAIRLVRAYDGTSGVLSTKELRQRAGFPTGKEQRAAYLRGVEELDSRLILAKTFGAEGEGDDMNHALVSDRYAEFVEQANAMTQVEAFEDFFARYLPQAILVDPKVLGKHLRLPPNLVAQAVDALVSKGKASLHSGFVVTG